jgi:DNA (cytosine-5)-methyltransferase 1
MEGGKVLVMVKHTLAEAGYGIDVWKLNSENYGVPQRRQRILLIGTREGKERLSMPTPITQFKQQYCLTTSPQIFSVCESLDDLPPVQPGEDACSLPYRGEPSNVFQQFARGYITPAEYIERIRMGERK